MVWLTFREQLLCSNWKMISLIKTLMVMFFFLFHDSAPSIAHAIDDFSSKVLLPNLRNSCRGRSIFK